MSAVENDIRFPPGLSPGAPNPGGFKRGDDPRRNCGLKIYDGMTLAQMARQQGPASLQLLVRARDDEDVPMAQRIRAAEMILDRGYGKAVTVIDTRSADIKTLSRDELLRIAAGGVPRQPITIEGEVVEISLAVVEAVDGENQ